MDVDGALGKVGGYRRWHLAMFCFLSIFGYMSISFQGTNIVFIGVSPEHHCRLPEGQPLSNTTIPWVSEDNGGHWDKCRMYSNYSLGNETTECLNGWTYESDIVKTSIVTEWDLVCNKDYLSGLSQTIYQFGALIGDLFCSAFIDKFGRKKIFLGGTFLSGLSGIATSLSPNYTFFCVFRVFAATAASAQSWAALTLLMELFDAKHRAFAGIGINFLWVVNYLVLGGIAYFLREWRHLQLASSLLVLPAMVAIWILPESPLWLVANGYIEKAEKVLQDMARYNRVKVPVQMLASSNGGKPFMSTHSTETETVSPEEVDLMTETKLPIYPWTKLFTDSTLRRQTVISSFLWFANYLVYNSLVLASPTLPGDMYLTFVLGTLIEIPAYTTAYFIVTFLGRRMPTVFFHTAAGVALGLISLIPKHTADGNAISMLIIALALVGRFTITTSFAIIVLYTTEIFPTNLRATSAGLTTVPARLGNMAAPLVLYAANRIAWLPNVVLAVTSIIAAGITLLLPETMGTQLPQTIADVEVMYEGHKICSCQLRRDRNKSTANAATEVIS